ncbi:hypothetical protein BY996DRAFT_4568743, partial [Phakopsora pachyrhizi]
SSVPDRFGFLANFRSRESLYGLLPPLENDLRSKLEISSWNESEGWFWYTPQVNLRLINQRWNRLATEVFFQHLSICSFSRLVSFGLLFQDNRRLSLRVRTLSLNLSPLEHQKAKNDNEIRLMISKLLKPLRNLKSFSLRGLAPGLLFPNPLIVKNLFLPTSILRLGIEFSDDSSRLIGSMSLNDSQQNFGNSNGLIKTKTKVLLHSAELNLLLVSLPRLKTLNISNFRSDQRRPLEKY